MPRKLPMTGNEALRCARTIDPERKLGLQQFAILSQILEFGYFQDGAGVHFGNRRSSEIYPVCESLFRRGLLDATREGTVRIFRVNPEILEATRALLLERTTGGGGAGKRYSQMALDLTNLIARRAAEVKELKDIVASVLAGGTATIPLAEVPFDSWFSLQEFDDRVFYKRQERGTGIYELFTRDSERQVAGSGDLQPILLTANPQTTMCRVLKFGGITLLGLTGQPQSSNKKSTARALALAELEAYNLRQILKEIERLASQMTKTGDNSNPAVIRQIMILAESAESPVFNKIKQI